MDAAPPPLPPLKPVTPLKSAHHQAALAGLAAPVLAILLTVALGLSVQSSPDAMAPVVKMIGGFASVILIVTGLAASIYALSGIGQHGRHGLLGRGLTGLLINGFFVLLFVAGFIGGFARGKKNQQARQTLEAAINEVQDAQRENFNPETGITNFDRAATERMLKVFDSAAKNTGGDDAKVLTAASRLMQGLAVEGKKFEQLVQELMQAEVLAADKIKTKADIETRRAMISRFMAANRKLIAKIEGMPDAMRNDLVSQGMPAAKIAQVSRGFIEGSKSRFNLILEIRNCDARLGTNMLATLNLLESNWGRWRYDQTSDKIAFDSDATAESYDLQLTVMNKLAEQQVELQRQLVNLPNTSLTPGKGR